MLKMEVLQQILDEEFGIAKEKVMERVLKIIGTQDAEYKAPLPPNPKYQRTMELYLAGVSQRKIAEELRVSVGCVRKYLRYLAINGYIDKMQGDLTDNELAVMEQIGRGKSLIDIAKNLDISVTRVTYLRDSALAKGYIRENESVEVEG